MCYLSQNSNFINHCFISTAIVFYAGNRLFLTHIYNLTMSSEQSIPQTQAIQIVQPTSDHAFELKLNVLETILSADGISDRNVVVVSVVGALRQGKSFLLNFFLQYLNARVSHNKSNRIY